MAKIFTITEGLENLGALKSGGQGSVYKARRTGEIISAIKILPTPIYSENDDDKNYRSFRNEVEKLKKVNETPNPNVVAMVASGITSTGNLPYIEMEYIEGPDLAELLNEPYDPVFTIKEVIKVADHLSNALAHCHRADVKHGDIKSNNVKFNQRTGNYMLLDFGLSIMSDEQRRTSIRHAGAIEFMAPEQSEGEMLFETDVYSFGIIMFELLAGIVPFPLNNKGDLARNNVMLAHMEATAPDLLALRRAAIPGSWNIDKQSREMMVPLWIVEMIYKCLEKIPANRFRDGVALQDFIHSRIIAEESKKVMHIPAAQNLIDPAEEAKLKRQLDKLALQVVEKDNLISDLKYKCETREQELYQLQYAEQYGSIKKKGVSTGSFVFVLFIALGLGGYNFYDNFIKPYQGTVEDTSSRVNSKAAYAMDTAIVPKTKPVKKIKAKPFKKTITIPVAGQSAEFPNKSKYGEDSIAPEKESHANKYKVISTAYFYDLPNAKSSRDEYLTAGNAVFTAILEKADFIYVRFINSDGDLTHGWLQKKKLSRVYDYK